MQARYKVDLIEYEKGWGSKVEDTRYFKTFEKAIAFVKVYNKYNTGPVPDWYMVASDPVLVDLDRVSI